MNDAAFEQAMALHQTGHFDEAAAAYRTILHQDPDHADSLHLLGLITAERADPLDGIALIRRAMALDPGRAAHFNSLGHAYRRLGRPEDAVRAYRAAAALRPVSAEIHNNLATTLLDLGQAQEALAHYRLAVAHAPDMGDIWYNLANVLADNGTPAETETCYRNAIRLKPNFADALGNFGRWLMTRNRWDEAETALSQSLTLAPMQAGTWNNLGIASEQLRRPEAETCFRTAVDIEPRLADAHYNLGCLLFNQGSSDDAIACHDTAIQADPNFGTARLGACMAQLPILYRTESEIADRRQRYTTALNHLVTQDDKSLADAIGTSQPFFLPYQGQNDRTLQSAYGTFACDVLACTHEPAPLSAPPAQGERIRLGIVSGFFCDHTLAKLFLEGWVTQLDRSRFEIIGFHTGRTADAKTNHFATACDRFIQGLTATAAWRDAVIAAAPHVLLYPEIGIDPIAGRLAAMRLAPVQCVTWGQPETTGMPTIDYFLSSDLMEPPDADAHYTERLVRLPNLGLHYTPDPLYHGKTTFGLDPSAPIFWSGQALYKYLPQYDSIFPRIAAELGACQFVFIGFAKSQAVTDIFHHRLSQAFANAGLDAERHIVILPPMSQQDYINAAGQADIILDTPGWSGGKSTLDCLTHNPAIVTLPGPFMRGRHTAAILQQIGIETTTARSVDEYVAIAVGLARDPAWRTELRQTMATNKHRAFDDLTYIRTLENVLTQAAITQQP